MAHAPLSGDSIAINRRFLDSLLVEGRIVGAAHPSAKAKILGCDFDTPIMTAALSHLKPGMLALAEGAKQANAACCVGMGDNDELRAVLATGAKVIKIIKPYADADAIFSRIECARDHGALAGGMDIEHSVNAADDRDSGLEGGRQKS